jgi:hypothetical protein
MDSALTLILLVVNAAFAFGFGPPLAKRLAARAIAPGRPVAWFFALVGIYFAESMAFSASMGSNLFSWCLAAAWSYVFARKLQARELLLLSLYSSLPALSFLASPLAFRREGWALLSASDGYRFGIPTFFPWPLGTVLGFVVAVSASAVVGKILITTLLGARLRRRTS